MRNLSFLRVLAALGLCMVIAPAAARAATITFDDLSGSENPVPNGYGGLNWGNFYYLNADTYGTPSGYQNGTVSHPNVAYNAFGSPANFSSATPFTLNSAYFTGAWNDGLMIEAQGFLGGSLVHDVIFTVNTSGPTLEKFNWTNVDNVNFISSGGTPHGYSGAGEHFAMDNLTINEAVVPEPASLTLLGLGAFALGSYALRRRKAVAA
jgi:PEP-CTERM motif